MFPSSATAIIEEDWMYFKQNEQDNWMLKYCRFQPPFLFIYKNEDLKREGKPDIVLIINSNLTIHKSNDRIAYCGFLRLKQKFSTTRDHWSVITHDGYIIIGKLYHIDITGNRQHSVSPRGTKFGIKSKKSQRKSKRHFSVGMIDDMRQNRSGFGVIAAKEHDDIERIYKWDITNVMIIYCGSPEVMVEERNTKEKLAQLRFQSKEEAALFTNCIRSCGEYLDERRQNWSPLHPDITGIGKPLFPLKITDKEYNRNYFFISLNCSGIDKWYSIINDAISKGIEPSIKPLINRLEMDDSSLVNLPVVDEIYDFISRDLNVNNLNINCVATQRINNLPLEKRLLILHMNAISNSAKGVCYWIAILDNPKYPKNVLKLFQRHLDKQNVKKAIFIQEFVENDGLISLLSIQKGGKESTLLAKVFESIASAPPFNESITEDKARQKYRIDKDKDVDEKESVDLKSDKSDKMIARSSKQLIREQTTNLLMIGSPANHSIKTIQIRYKSGAEVLFDSEQRDEVIFELVTSIWGYHVTEIQENDLLPCIAVVKCLFTLCLLKPEFASIITSILLDSTDLGKENDNWWSPIVSSMENVFYLFKTATTIFSGTRNMFIIRDKCKQYMFAVLTLVLTIIDCFEIKDRIIERRLLDATSFNDLLFNIAQNINDDKIHSIIELYKESKVSDINEITYSQMEISQQLLDYLRDRAITNGFHEYLSNILRNMAAFPDDSELAWNNVDEYVFHWRNKLNGVDDEESVKSMEKEEEALAEALNKLESEKDEINSKYQIQLKKNNELQEVLNEYNDKITVLQNKLKETEEKKAQNGNDKDSVVKPAPQTHDPQLPPLSAEDEALVQKYKRQLAIKVPKPAIIHKLKFKEKKAHLIPYLFPQQQNKEKKPNKVTKVTLPPLNDADEAMVQKYKKQFAMKVPKAAIIHKLKFREKKAHLIPYVFPQQQNQENKPKAIHKNVDLPDDVDTKPVITPNVPMLAFHWNKIKECELKHTVWYDIYHKYGKQKENQLFSVDKLDELFGKPQQTKNKKSNKKKKSKIKKNAASEVVVLDKKTRNKVEIFLNRVRMSWKMSTMEICDNICNMNESGLSEDQIDKLITIAPNVKEGQEFMRRIKSLNPSSDILGAAALFWQELLTIDKHIKDRLKVWHFKLGFKLMMDEERIKTDLLNECVKRIRENDGFKLVLSLSLDIGNYVNGGKRQGAAFGFNIATLEKLDEFPRRRNADGSAVPTMLEYIYKLLKESHPSALSWTNDLQILNEATAIDLNVINTNCNKMEKSIRLIHERLKSTKETQISGKHFIDKMKPFYEDSHKELMAFKDCVNTLNKDLKTLAKWFDVEDEDIVFLKQLNSFRITFESIGARLMKRKKDAERKAKRFKKEKKKKKKKKNEVIKEITTPGFTRRGTILASMATSLSNELSTENISSRIRAPSMNRRASVNRGGLRNELMILAASVNTLDEEI